jgi:imidazolonepropionase-like amidohydrolase
VRAGILAMLACAALVPGAAPAAAQPDALVLRGARVHTATGPAIDGATSVIRDGRIAAVGPAVAGPPGAEVIDVTGREIIPGMMDNHSHIGFDIGDVNERAMRFAPRHRITDVLSPVDRYWSDAAKGGITTVVTGPGSGMVSSGQSPVVKTWGPDVDTRILRPRGGSSAST